jgi:tRNA (mo5U34)-methyltransferase
MQKRIDAIDWYHEFDFGHGLKATTTVAAGTHRQLWSFIEKELDRLDLFGKTVLDTGCWDGYWSFYAERKGAKVLATDDATQNWAGAEGFMLAKELFQSKVEFDFYCSVYDLTKLARKFDVIFFLGVYYHLVDPMYAFAQLRHCCHADTIVIVEGDVHVGGARSVAVYEPFARKGSRFVPTPDTLELFLNLNYFKTEYESMIDHFELINQEAPLDMPPRINRTFRICRPEILENPVHFYKPPFGLAKYDLRWQS